MTAQNDLPALERAVREVEWLCALEDVRALSAAQDTLHLAQTLHAPAHEVRVRLAVAWTLLDQDPHAAGEDVERAAALAAPLNDAALTAHVECMAARVALSQGDAPTVLGTARRALAAAEAAEHAEHCAHAHSLIGVALLMMGDYAHALLHHQEVLKHLGRVTSPSLRACLLCDIGANFNDFGTPEDARAFLEQALAVADEHQLRFSRVMTRENLGRTLMQLGQCDNGARLLHEGLDAALHEGIPRWEAYFRSTIGEVDLERGRVDAAYAQLTRAAHVADDVSDAYLTTTVYSVLGRVLRALGRLDEARTHLERALADATQAELLGPAKNAHRALSDVLAEQGAYREALTHFQQYHDLAMKVQVEEVRRHTQLLQVQRELELERSSVQAQRRLNEELQRANAQVQEHATELARLAREDALTGVANRRHFMDHLTLQARHAPTFAAIVLDADHFKSINDQFGHPTGDEVLRVIGRVLQQHVRAGDVVARLGGEEFGVLLLDADRARALDVAERIRAALATHPWADVAPGAHVTVSAGVAHATEVDSPDALIALADRRLYQAKQGGRDRVV
ncbi:GGDEF domain-containing protein [Deinococcus maricopensis]|uniref:Diguanylate cyclase n=1 Tax=Deinococcus maricopensis (strain DSM 21211 / LMG 22137 / NRRL B-23946 / LB-34) TaxID=709986 RepID=E8UAH8_DEIML|nr:diguanylate cyclase [Deinococcus maricopensis]ADV68067.1 diguanylate cyclase [Deinococcus maricopensis DSM 21211]